MVDDGTDDRLEMRWLPVEDGAGRTRMEAVWICVATVGATDGAAVVHAA